ncbi:hypothetical protein MAPG_09565 [Magnaporthiopsis poae ATCC 64411]|uniref:Uncharacterized protein n=1 Tax=Magnaporthiopsis poae (strain ATCC 64411 / 73-15) TaxID=644358 RepID=A0A0C4EAA3_MAGP6|nr:hypothetical protein MAPG_09565 [Magnaporthiopsis poae ATCC 64411]
MAARDLELGPLLQDMVDSGAVLTVVLDSCHSGGALRASRTGTAMTRTESGRRLSWFWPHAWRRTPERRTYRQGLLTHWLLDTARITPASLAGRTICDRVRAKVAAQAGEQTQYIVSDLNQFILIKGVRSKAHAPPVRSVDTRSKVPKNRSL